MRIYVCWDTRTSHPVIGEHPCGLAHRALVEAGYEPDVVHAFGWKALPAVLNQTPGRRAVKRLTGSYDVPVLELDDGDVIQGSQSIIEWAEANPAAPTAA